MTYRYHDGTEVNKRILKGRSSLFIFAREDSPLYGASVILEYDEGDNAPRCFVSPIEGDPKSQYVSYHDLIYLGEMK